jgi:hypothetical protein
MNLSKFINTSQGKTIMSILLGVGLATMFKHICIYGKCIVQYDPNPKHLIDKIFKSNNNQCVAYSYTPVSCSKDTNAIFLPIDTF